MQILHKYDLHLQKAAMGSSGIPKSCWEHSQFFDRLVYLVPAKFYHNDEAPLQNLKYMKKDAR